MRHAFLSELFCKRKYTRASASGTRQVSEAGPSSVRAVSRSKDKQAVPGGDGNVLLAVHLIADRPGNDFPAEIHLPQQRAGVRIERLEIALTSAGEKQVRCSGQDPAAIDVVHLEAPLLFSGMGIKGHDGAMTERLGVGVDRALAGPCGIIGTGNGAGVCAAGVAQAFFVIDIYPREDRRIALPTRDVEQAGARAVGRRMPVAPALDAGEGRRARRLGRRYRPAFRIQAAGPVHLYKWRAGEKFSRRPV